jgi:hypothetical protein
MPLRPSGWCVGCPLWIFSILGGFALHAIPKNKGQSWMPNARGKPRRSGAEGTNSAAVVFRLTNQLGRGAMQKR